MAEKIEDKKPETKKIADKKVVAEKIEDKKPERQRKSRIRRLWQKR